VVFFLFSYLVLLFFFFQAEDGIRDFHVTGVQTCALPICLSREDFESTRDFLKSYIKLYISTPANQLGYLMDSRFYGRENFISEMDQLLSEITVDEVNKIGRAHV